MILVRNITLQHKIDAFLGRKFKEHPRLEQDQEALLATRSPRPTHATRE